MRSLVLSHTDMSIVPGLLNASLHFDADTPLLRAVRLDARNKIILALRKTQPTPALGDAYWHLRNARSSEALADIYNKPDVSMLPHHRAQLLELFETAVERDVIPTLGITTKHVDEARAKKWFDAVWVLEQLMRDAEPTPTPTLTTSVDVSVPTVTITRHEDGSVKSMVFVHTVLHNDEEAISA